MQATLFAAALATNLFNYYPGIENPNNRIQAVIDKGLIAELVVKCEVGTGIVAASLVDRVYCTPKFECTPQLALAIKKTCGE